MKKLLFTLLSLGVFFVACDDTPDYLSYEEQLAIDIGKIEDYLQEKDLTAESTESGLHYIIDEEGTGSVPTIDSIVEVKYVGKFLSDEVFADDTTKAELWKYISGWQEGIPLFKEGGSGTLFIPSSLGYGYYEYDEIPPNSVLIFELELLDVLAIDAE